MMVNWLIQVVRQRPMWNRRGSLSPSRGAKGAEFSFLLPHHEVIQRRLPRQTTFAIASSFSLLFSGTIATSSLPAQDKLPLAVKAKIDFVRDVEPILHTKCYECHGAVMQMNGLRFDQKEAALKGGYSGPAIVAASSAKSPLILRIASTKDGFKMPPAGPALTARQIGVLRAWIDQGASWPDAPAVLAGQTLSQAERRSHWSFQPVQRPAEPSVRQRSWGRNPIDSFILAKLEAEGVAPSLEADKSTLLRRLSLDLTGLPPTSRDVAAFLMDNSPEAYERQVDRLLASPHYGEKWARQWLDLARYADSDGYEKDLPRRYAWRWRQWVIEALNADMPFDQFTLEQMAGDLLPGATFNEKTATGFHRNGLKNREAGVKRDEARFEELVDRASTLGTTWLGLTVGCAQCHDHKYDPISQKDFYQLLAFFNSTEDAVIDAPLPGELGPHLQSQPGFYGKRSELLKKHRVPELQPQWEARLRQAMDVPGKNLDWDFQVTAIRAMLDGAEKLLRKDEKLRTQREQDQVVNYFVRNPGPELAKDKETTDKFKELVKQLQELDKAFPSVSQSYVLMESPSPVKTFVAVRGDYRRPGVEVPAEAPHFLPPLPQTAKPSRARLADWLVSRDNPLTARVAVNRMWQEFFGRGLVRTSDDFGAQGDKPTHPALLDWLATEFMEGGWRVKRMHKQIVMSAAYRQSSNARFDLKERDPGNLLLARQNRLRLSAEQVRDAALQASGLLYPAIGGESIRPPQPESVSKLTYGSSKWEENQGRDRYRRGLYIHYQRTSPYPQLVNFDAPDASVSAAQRRRSNTPLQALNLLNDPVFLEAAQALAVRVLQESAPGWNERLDTAFQLCLSRKPSRSERDRLASYYEEQKKLNEKDTEALKQLTPNPVTGVQPAEVAAWTGLSRVLMNLDEFITRE
jgi:Protein of unknown function (DUF1553)/Protein of unknown function (DUF1549)/Planctomycete cytochrome C